MWTVFCLRPKRGACQVQLSINVADSIDVVDICDRVKLLYAYTATLSCKVIQV